MSTPMMAAYAAPEKIRAHVSGWKRVSALLALGQWVCAPLLSCGSALLAVTLLSYIVVLHDEAHVLLLAGSLFGMVAPLSLMLRARSCHRRGLYGESIIASGLLILCATVGVINVLVDGRVF